MIPLIQTIIPPGTPVRITAVQTDCGAPFAAILDDLGVVTADEGAVDPAIPKVAASSLDATLPDSAVVEIPQATMEDFQLFSHIRDDFSESQPTDDAVGSDRDLEDGGLVTPIDHSGTISVPPLLIGEMPALQKHSRSAERQDACAKESASNLVYDPTALPIIVVPPAVAPLSRNAGIEMPPPVSQPPADLVVVPQDQQPAHTPDSTIDWVLPKAALSSAPTNDDRPEVPIFAVPSVQANVPVSAPKAGRDAQPPSPTARNTIEPALSEGATKDTSPYANPAPSAAPQAMTAVPSANPLTTVQDWIAPDVSNVPPAAVEPSHGDANLSGLEPAAEQAVHPKTHLVGTTDKSLQHVLVADNNIPDDPVSRQITEKPKQFAPLSDMTRPALALSEFGQSPAVLRDMAPVQPSRVKSSEAPLDAPGGETTTALAVDADTWAEIENGPPVPLKPRASATDVVRLFTPVDRPLQPSVSALPKPKSGVERFDVEGLALAVAHPTAPAHLPPSIANHTEATLPPTVISDLLNIAQLRPDAPADLTLNPEELGRLRFEMTQSGDTIRVVLTVERADTLDLLRRNADQLMAEFKQAGFTGTTLSFGQWRQGSAYQSSRQPTHINSKPAESGAIDAGFTQPKARRVSSGLDLRL